MRPSTDGRAGGQVRGGRRRVQRTRLHESAPPWERPVISVAPVLTDGHRVAQPEHRRPTDSRSCRKCDRGIRGRGFASPTFEPRGSWGRGDAQRRPYVSAGFALRGRGCASPLRRIRDLAGRYSPQSCTGGSRASPFRDFACDQGIRASGSEILPEKIRDLAGRGRLAGEPLQGFCVRSRDSR
jgi:hypothetical protein